jgi:hypothetical protein
MSARSGHSLELGERLVARSPSIHHMEPPSVLNIVFLALAAALVWRAGQTGGFGRMMNTSPEKETLTRRWPGGGEAGAVSLTHGTGDYRDR